MLEKNYKTNSTARLQKQNTTEKPILIEVAKLPKII